MGERQCRWEPQAGTTRTTRSSRQVEGEEMICWLYLAPSKRHGIGVFAARRIIIGKCLPLFAEKDWRWLSRYPRHIGARFCTKGDGGVYAPYDWHRISIGWYLNHSEKPNVSARTWRSLRPICAGEELTISYSELGEK